MAKIQEILTVERNRGESDMLTIHLWKSGGFYRAYEYSAWLIVTYCYLPNEGRTDFKPLSVSKKTTKNGEEFCFVGFPLKSILKFIPNYSFSPIDDDHISLVIALQSESLASYADFAAWKDSVQINKEKRRNALSISDEQTQIDTLQTLSKILSYPLERKTPLENTEFISRLKEEVALLF